MHAWIHLSISTALGTCNVLSSRLGARNTVNPIARCLGLPDLWLLPFYAWNLAPGRDFCPFSSTFGLSLCSNGVSQFDYLNCSFHAASGRIFRNPARLWLLPLVDKKSWSESGWLTSPAWLGLRAEELFPGCKTITLETKTDGFPRWRLSALQSDKPGHQLVLPDRPGLLVLLLLSVSDVCTAIGAPSILCLSYADWNWGWLVGGPVWEGMVEHSVHSGQEQLYLSASAAFIVK